MLLRDLPGAVPREVRIHYPTVNDRPPAIPGYDIYKRRQRERAGVVLPVKHAHYSEHVADPNAPESADEPTIAVCSHCGGEAQAVHFAVDIYQSGRDPASARPSRQ